MYHVDISNTGGSVFKVKSKDYEFVVDTKGNGITPPDTLLASLGTCMGVYIRKYMAGTKLLINEFSITLDASLTEERPVRFKEITVSIDIKGAPLDDMRRNSLLEFIKNCPVHNTLTYKPEISVALK